MRKAVRWAALVSLCPLLVSLCACKREPTFDERYDAATRKIVDKAKAIDAQVSGAPASESSGESSGAD
jgi:hypothetical protein